MANLKYKQHSEKAVAAHDRFSHVMAIALDPTRDYKDGVIRCIKSRTGDPAKSGNVDRSELYRVEAHDLDHICMTKPLVIHGQKEIIEDLRGGDDDQDFIGLEDPDIFFDDQTKLLHLYFTIPFLVPKAKGFMPIHLGHAVGKDLDSLEMTVPAITASSNDMRHSCAKELSVAPKNSRGVKLNLVESFDMRENVGYSVVRIAIAEDMGKPWKLGDVVFHPKDTSFSWIAGHASPGPLLPKSFIDIGHNRLLGIMNGRGANIGTGKDKIYRPFTVGLFIYDYEVGKIEWVSPESIIRDTEAKNITFASQFIETGKGEGILYAHVDDSFVRAYTLYADGLRSLLPK